MTRSLTRTFVGLAAAWVLTLLAACDRPPVQPVQRGYSGSGMALLYNKRTLAAEAENNTAPEIAPPARVRPNAPKAGDTYKNIQVLGDLSIGEFGRTMNAIAGWVAPVQGCAYCHVDGDLASDAKYTKVVARRMMQMVRHLNADWSAHVGGTGVTCYTCHRGNPLPKQTWFRQVHTVMGADFIGNRAGQNAPAPALGLAALPSDPFGTFLLTKDNATSIRVASTTALPTGNRQSIQRTEATYGLMLHMSKALGVNCTFCHNSRSFSNWAESSPQRATAWQGIRMARDINTTYLEPLGKSFPAVPVGRLGAAGDTAKVHCATCHQGANKPLYGAQMAKHYPAFWATAASAPAAAASAAPVPGAPASAPAPGEPAASAAELMAAPRPATAASVVAVVAVAPPPVASAVAAPAPAASPATQPVAAASGPRVIAEVRPPAPAVPVVNCIDVNATATAAATRVQAEAAQQQVVGTGPLKFYSAPDAACEMLGVFISAGETVEALAERGGYTSVRYRRPGSAAQASGWVASDRLVPNLRGRPAAASTEVAAAMAPASATAPAAEPASPGECQALQSAAPVKRVDAAAAARTVTGRGRLPFHSAPDTRCVVKGLFILTGEPVQARAVSGAFTSIDYVNPRTGRTASGWVLSERLGKPGTPP